MNVWGRRLAIALVAFQVMLPIAMVVHFRGGLAHPARSDAGRYQAIATAPGRPYVDTPTEYPPAAVLLFEAMGPRPFRDFFLRLIVLQALAQGVIVAAIFWAWGRRAGWRYLALSAPLLAYVLTRFDLVSVAVAVVGAALVARGRQVAGGLLVALGAFLKVWPAALLPGLVTRRRWRAAAAGWASLAAGSIAWLVYAGTDGVREVFTYRGSTGWHLESVPGSLLYLLRGTTPHFQHGAWRVGAPPGVASALLAVGLGATVLWCWWRAGLGANVGPGVVETTVVAALLAWATLLSPQFVAWLLPWAAIAGAYGARRVEQATWAVVALTVAGIELTTDHARPALVQELTYLARNVAVVLVVVAGVLAIARARTQRTSEVQPALR